MAGQTTEERDQRKLHSWPDWDTSVHTARERLEFNPDWTPRPETPPGREYLAWMERVELRRLRFEARRALIDLRLPERFAGYWLACFLAPYDHDSLDLICDPQTDGTISDRRVYPPPVELWFDAGIDYSSAPFKLLIEGPAELASSTLLRGAIQRALAAKRAAGFPSQHSLVHARQIGPVLEERALARSEERPDRAKAKRQALAWSRNGDPPGFIAYRLSQRGYQVHERTVRRWLRAAQDGKIDTPSGQNDPPPSES